MIPQVALYFLFIGTWFIQLLTLIIISIFKTRDFSSYPFLTLTLYSVSSLCYDLAFVLTKPIPMNISFMNRMLDQIMVRQGHYELFIYFTSTIITVIYDYYIYYHFNKSENFNDERILNNNSAQNQGEQQHVSIPSRNYFNILTWIRMLLMSTLVLAVNIYGCYLLNNTAYKNSIFIRILPLPHVILHVIFYVTEMIKYCRTRGSELYLTREIEQRHQENPSLKKQN
ncbi:hypothetical protein FDP41_006266 [Naegleria fowleri]|uniref:Uncharacterized protein n=1 Tax=Naegleria fowleri TaxID=5763 RepID=A0A6A5BIW1_NAEFO|nr:uncharacterized protein FDP41_006266 [Naegleria fowleri]KAF0974792.1 hypothetical protein FDP41_006266 [Naegleria fowleri]